MLFAKNHSTLRRKMVQNQIEARGIHDPQILDVMRRVERHLFVKPQYRNVAYKDGPLPIGCGPNNLTTLYCRTDDRLARAHANVKSA